MTIGAVLLFMAVLVAFVWAGAREPEYQEKTLSYWLIRGARAPGGEGDEECKVAVRQIGTNALPLLLKWLQHEPWYRKRAVSAVMRRLPQSVWRSAVMQKAMRRDGERAYAAYQGFRWLGKQASPAIGELTNMLRSSPPIADRAIYELAMIGEPGYPVLKGVVLDPKAGRLREKAIL